MLPQQRDHSGPSGPRIAAVVISSKLWRRPIPLRRSSRADLGLGGDVEKLNQQRHEMSKRAIEAVKKLKEEHEREMEAMRQLFR